MQTEARCSCVSSGRVESGAMLRDVVENDDELPPTPARDAPQALHEVPERLRIEPQGLSRRQEPSVAQADCPKYPTVFRVGWCAIVLCLGMSGV